MVFKRGVSEGENGGLLAHLLSLRLSFETRNTLSRHAIITPLTLPLAAYIFIYTYTFVRRKECFRTNKGKPQDLQERSPLTKRIRDN